MQIKDIAQWVVRGVPALILLQTLYFKFTGQPESIFIFETVGMEPWGRYGSGIAEGIAAILLFIPGLSVYGALLACGVLSGAIFFHLTCLGIEVQGDGGALFILALVAFVCCAYVIWDERKKILRLIRKDGD